MGSKNQTTTSQSSTTPTNSAGLQSIYNQVQAAASNPYNPYGGQLTAPINSQQQLGIAGINSAAGTAQPYYQQAAQYAQSGASAIDPSQIERYQNPYTQSVIKATQDNFNESNGQQQQQVKGNLALSGALGGSRQAVAQAETARQQTLAQAPVIAGLNQQNYTQALQAAQADRTAQQYGAGAYAGIGQGAQTAALQGAGAQLQAGTQEQQTQQAALDAQYKQYLQQQAFPYQQAQFFAQYGTPAALAQGSTTNGTQTSPGPNPWSQIAGLGIAGAGLFAKDGGRIEGYADGGSAPFNFINDAPGFIPHGNAPQVQMPQSQPMQMSGKGSAAQTDPWAGPIAQLGKMKGNWAGEEYGGGNALTSEYGGSSSNPLAGLDASDYGAGFSHGGLVEAIHHIHQTIKRSRGGSVIDVPFQGYAKGGNVRRYADGGPTFDDRFSAAFSPQEPIPGEQPFRLAGPEAMDAWRKSHDNPAVVADAGVPTPAPQAAPTPANPMRVALPKQITGPEPEEEPSSAMAYDSTPAKNPMAMAPPAAPEAPQQQFGKSLFGVNLSDKTRQALVAAGLGMAASKSPFALTAIGEGGLHGVKAYTEAGAAEQAAAEKKVTAEREAKRLLMQIESQKETARHNKATEQKEYKPTYGVIGEDTVTGAKRYGWIDPNKQTTTPVAGQEAPARSDSNLTGEEYLKTLPPDQAAIVQKVANYEMDPKLLSIRGGHRERILGAASRVNPGFDSSLYPQRYAVQKDFTSGKTSQNLASFNTAIGHLDTLEKSIDKLGNFTSPTINKITGAISGEVNTKYQENLKEFRAAKTAVADELTRAFRGTGGNVHDIVQWEKAISETDSPQALKSAVKTAVDLLKSRIEAIGDNYNRGMGSTKQGIDLLSPKAKKAIERLEGGHADTSAGVQKPKPATVTQNGHTYTLQPDGSYK